MKKQRPIFYKITSMINGCKLLDGDKMKMIYLFLFMTYSFLINYTYSKELSFNNKWGSGYSLNGNRPTAKNWSRIITDGKGTPSFFTANFFITNQNIVRFKIRIKNMKNFSGIQFRIGDKSFKKYDLFDIPHFSDIDFNIVQEGDWHTYSIGLAKRKIPLNKYFGVYIEDNKKGPLIVDLADIELSSSLEKGALSITFDDGHYEHYEAAQIMSRYKMRGTAYIMPRQIGKSGYLSLEQLKNMNAKFGWGVSSHHKTPLVNFSPKELVEEINFTLDYLNKNGLNSSSKHLAYPLGKQNRTFVLSIVKQFFETARVAGGGVETIPPADYHLLRTINVLNTDSAESIFKKVKKAYDNGHWAILMFHHLVDNPKNEMQYSLEEFKKLIVMLSENNIYSTPVHKILNTK